MVVVRRGTLKTYTQNHAKAVPALDYSAVSVELVSISSYHCSGDSHEKEKQADSRKRQPHLYDTCRNFAGLHISAVARFNRLLHTPPTSSKGFGMGEGPNSPKEALHIIPWLRWFGFIKEWNGHRAPHCANRSGGCLLEASNLCFGFIQLYCVGGFVIFFPEISTFLETRP